MSSGLIARASAAELLAWAALVLSAIAAAAGLFVSNLYKDTPFWTEQTRGIDLATLFLVVPILGVSLVFARRGSIAAHAFELGVVLYLVYNYAIYATSVHMNRLAFVYIAILGLSLWTLILLVSSSFSATVRLLLPAASIGRVAAVFLLVVVILFGPLWLSQIAGTTATGNLPADLQRAGLPANPVYALDLAIFLPLAAVAAIGVLRGIPALGMFAVPMLVWVFLTSAGIVAGFFFEARAGEQVPLPVGILIGALGFIGIVLAAVASVTAAQST